MLLIIEIALALAYGVLAHLAAAWRNDVLSLAALLALVAMLLAAPIAARRAWAWLALPLLVAAAWWLYAAGHAGVPPPGGANGNRIPPSGFPPQTRSETGTGKTERNLPCGRWDCLPARR